MEPRMKTPKKGQPGDGVRTVREGETIVVDDTLITPESAKNRRAHLTGTECPRFHTCNASLCPLGEDPSHTGYHVRGEPVCYYLRMSGKAGAAERFADEPAFAACLDQLPAIARHYPSIGRAVSQAAKSGFPSAHLMKVNAPKKAVCRGAPLVGYPL